MGSVKNQKYISAFGNNLRRLRTGKKLSMEKLAQLANIEYSQISDIELAKINTTISTVNAIAEALNIPTKDLFDF